MQRLIEQQSEFAARLLCAHSPEAMPGMAVYRSNVFGNRSGALAGAYPIVRKIVGEPFFRALAREYAQACPSASGDLNDYGASLPEFLATSPDARDLPYLPDVARMEWLAHRAYYAAPPVDLDIDRLLTVPSAQWGALRLGLSPASALLASDWPLERIWSVHQDAYAGGIDVDPASGPDRILVHRPRWRVHVQSLAPGDHRFLEAARHGETLGDALEAAARDPSFDASTALARWVHAGVVAL